MPVLDRWKSRWCSHIVFERPSIFEANPRPLTGENAKTSPFLIKKPPPLPHRPPPPPPGNEITNLGPEPVAAGEFLAPPSLPVDANHPLTIGQSATRAPPARQRDESAPSDYLPTSQHDEFCRR